MPHYRAVIAIVLIACAVCLAQTREPSDAWLMKNYHFAGPPKPESLQPVSPMVAQLNEIQNTVLSIMRKTNFVRDYEGALFAADQAAGYAQLIGSITGELKPPEPGGPDIAQAHNPAPAHYMVAFRDGTIQAATAVWADHLMVHYTTLTGGHEQVRLDRVDWKLTAQLNPGGLLQRPRVGDGR